MCCLKQYGLKPVDGVPEQTLLVGVPLRAENLLDTLLPPNTPQTFFLVKLRPYVTLL